MKRITSFALACLMLLSCAMSCAAAPRGASPYSNPTIVSSSAMLDPGNKAGQMKINFTVTTDRGAVSLGVQTIKVFTDTSRHVRTITGTYSNGLVIGDVNGDLAGHGGTYYIDGLQSGDYYYAEVTVFATSKTTTGSYTHLTETVQAP